MNVTDWLDEREFYEIMQRYRHDPIGDSKCFEAVKEFIRDRIDAMYDPPRDWDA